MDLLMCSQCVNILLLTDYEDQCIRTDSLLGLWYLVLLITRIVVLGFMTHTIVLAALQSQRVSVYKSLVVKTKLSSLVFLTITVQLYSHLFIAHFRSLLSKESSSEVTLRLVFRSRLQHLRHPPLVRVTLSLPSSSPSS